MGNLKEVRIRITSVGKTQKITKAMKMVAAAKLKRAQSRIVQMRPYALKLKGMLAPLSDSLEGTYAAKYFEERPMNSVLLISVTSDRGLAGAFNSSVTKESFNLLNGKLGALKAAKKVEVISVGKKAGDAFARIEYPIAKRYDSLFKALEFSHADEIASYAMEGFIEGKFDRVYLVYNRFRNAAVYETTAEQFLPLAGNKVENGAAKGYQFDYIFEPSKEAIVDQLVNQSIKVDLFRALLESNAAEHGARMTAMDKATENAEERLRLLKLLYNKERQAAITKEILEIVGGAAALE